MHEITVKEYEKIRDEAKDFLEKALEKLPENFTLLHLECLEKVMPEVTAELLTRYKSEIKLSKLERRKDEINGRNQIQQCDC